MTMYKNYKEAKKAWENGDLSTQTLYNLELYFQVIEEPAEDIYVLNDWDYEEDDECNIITVDDLIVITRKELFQQYSERDLHGLTPLSHGDLIDCHGHILTADEIREIFWNMGN